VKSRPISSSALKNLPDSLTSHLVGVFLSSFLIDESRAVRELDTKEANKEFWSFLESKLLFDMSSVSSWNVLI
jgi:hypothetical protein